MNLVRLVRCLADRGYEELLNFAVGRIPWAQHDPFYAGERTDRETRIR